MTQNKTTKNPYAIAGAEASARENRPLDQRLTVNTAVWSKSVKRGFSIHSEQLASATLLFPLQSPEAVLGNATRAYTITAVIGAVVPQLFGVPYDIVSTEASARENRPLDQRLTVNQLPNGLNDLTNSPETL